MTEHLGSLLADAGTARELIARGAQLLGGSGLVFAHGTDNSLDEAAALVLHALDLDYGIDDRELDRALTSDQVRQARELLELRVRTRKPAAYLTHQAWFAGMPFYVDERVLIPRSPLAELVENRFQPWIDPDTVRGVLDLCTGSGCIGIACAHYFPDAEVILTDIAPDALQVAALNVERHDLAGRVTPLRSDVYAALGTQRFDIIVSNPPYVPAGEMAGLAAEFRYEPAQGLVAGCDGLDVAVRILADAAVHLRERGILVVEVGHAQDQLIGLFPDAPFLWLDFEYGGEGVLLLEREQLLAGGPQFAAALQSRTVTHASDVE
jgi:ribosomal protein L3 glutamine methyltransferase